MILAYEANRICVLPKWHFCPNKHLLKDETTHTYMYWYINRTSVYDFGYYLATIKNVKTQKYFLVYEMYICTFLLSFMVYHPFLDTWIFLWKIFIVTLIFFSPKNKANYFTLKYFDGFVFYWKMSRIWCFNMFEVFSNRRKNHKNWVYKHSSK